jgi:hypothetical protein
VVEQNGQSIEIGNACHTRQRIKTKQKQTKGQFNSYIDVIYPDLDVNVLMMLTKWYTTRFL